MHDTTTLNNTLRDLNVSANRYYFLYLLKVLTPLKEKISSLDTRLLEKMTYSKFNFLFRFTAKMGLAKFDSSKNYAELYHELIQELDAFEPHSSSEEKKIIEAIRYEKAFALETLPSAEEKQISDAIHSVMTEVTKAVEVNDNEILGNLGEAIELLDEEYARPGVSMSKILQKHLRPFLDDTHADASSPVRTGSLLGRAKHLHPQRWNPQALGRMTTIPDFGYKPEGLTGQQISIGTQARRRPEEAGEWHTGVSRTWERWIASLRNESDSEKDKSVVYFNLMHTDDSTFHPGTRLEAAASQALQEAEERHRNLYMVTLPADGGWMDRGNYLKSQPAAMLDHLAIAHSCERIQDAISSENGFWISDKTWQRITGIQDTKTPEYRSAKAVKLESLLNESCKTIFGTNYDKNKIISPADEQALFMEVRRRLSVVILKAINPDYYHFSCKDAIDRGSVASAFFNLIESMGEGRPITKKKFNEAIHAAALMTKGRGMNDHENILWNAVDRYVDANFKTIMEDENKCWLIRWRNMHCPKERIPDVLTTFLKQTAENDAYRQQPLSDESQSAMGSIREAAELQISRRGILLEAATRVTFPNGSESEKMRLIDLAERFTKNAVHPIFYQLAGALKKFIGTLVGNQALQETGEATRKRAVSVDSLQKLSTPLFNAFSKMSTVLSQEPEVQFTADERKIDENYAQSATPAA